jgi:succinyl-CoA synthetase beta subunit
VCWSPRRPTSSKELYLGAGRSRPQGVTFIASAEGGVDIEKVAAENPGKDHHPWSTMRGLQPYQCRKLGFAMGMNAKQVAS